MKKLKPLKRKTVSSPTHKGGKKMTNEDRQRQKKSEEAATLEAKELDEARKAKEAEYAAALEAQRTKRETNPTPPGSPHRRQPEGQQVSPTSAPEMPTSTKTSTTETKTTTVDVDTLPPTAIGASALNPVRPENVGKLYDADGRKLDQLGRRLDAPEVEPPYGDSKKKLTPAEAAQLEDERKAKEAKARADDANRTPAEVARAEEERKANEAQTRAGHSKK